ncbi:hypothetical protein [Spirosoma sordidisoli]|uniref:Uncharacterized protein n=1 Tax=Spirosoma sordidisoli TaxID=2502893 RepID=A0A4Q2UM69_9BACT|nr:hypothetical protein [Spirosoma sordidisoli]RYC70707.1 hypothetical protein EQG79_00715 [Spirosoma sordidisoli]
MNTAPMYKLVAALHLTDEQIKAYEELPDNGPKTKLTAAQTQFISRLYYDKVEVNGFRMGWGKELYEVEKKEGWPSGGRVSDAQAKRMVLNAVIHLNKRKELTAEQAAIEFKDALELRPTWQYIYAKAYERV